MCASNALVFWIVLNCIKAFHECAHKTWGIKNVSVLLLSLCVRALTCIGCAQWSTCKQSVDTVYGTLFLLFALFTLCVGNVKPDWEGALLWTSLSLLIDISFLSGLNLCIIQSANSYYIYLQPLIQWLEGKIAFSFRSSALKCTGTLLPLTLTYTLWYYMIQASAHGTAKLMNSSVF